MCLRLPPLQRLLLLCGESTTRRLQRWVSMPYSKWSVLHILMVAPCCIGIYQPCFVLPFPTTYTVFAGYCSFWVAVYPTQLFEDNFVHADLHAGNLLVRYPTTSSSTNSSSGIPMSSCSAPVLRQPQLVLLDAGLTVELRPADRRNFIRLFQAVIENKGTEVARLMMEYSPHRHTTTTVYSNTTSTIAAATIDTLQTQQQQQQKLDMNIMYPTVIRPDEYAQEMSKLVNTVHKQGLTLGKISVSELLRNVLHLSYEHNVKLESRFVSVIVAIMLAEGMGRRLNPDIDILTRAKPFIRQAALNSLLFK